MWTCRPTCSISYRSECRTCSSVLINLPTVLGRSVSALLRIYDVPRSTCNSLKDLHPITCLLRHCSVVRRTSLSWFRMLIATDTTTMQSIVKTVDCDAKLLLITTHAALHTSIRSPQSWSVSSSSSSAAAAAAVAAAAAAIAAAAGTVTASNDAVYVRCSNYCSSRVRDVSIAVSGAFRSVSRKHIDMRWNVQHAANVETRLCDDSLHARVLGQTCVRIAGFLMAAKLSACHRARQIDKLAAACLTSTAV